MITIISTCDRCRNEVCSNAKDLDSAVDPLNVIAAGGNTGHVCGNCLEHFIGLKQLVEDYRQKLYSEFWTLA